ncbi:Processing of GAS1 and ALP protein-like protein [Emericellopsis cladophorae]|uniref:Processing of GAS1 and ALP protein-like protein n=1 Tax=Emericellopsis cladophorae TaxID=2686198 RepID=A0A9Q0BFJ2_9HYPO|nr:Processing of GAS1 and ALP protein-like protein [Emericellopsis cladophorae]KAI6782961.1 Processing of GAS1 and ALP protein-like protein [Emericellopsis cladophorae]
MSSHEDEPPVGQTELNDFGKLTYQFLKFGQNASSNVSNAFNDMTIHQWLRLVVIVGAYLLLRPYVTTYLGKRQVESMEKQDKAEKEKAKISPNQLRGEKAGPYEEEEHDDDDEGAEATGVSGWGAKARTRQRVMLKKMLEAEEKRRWEEEEDEDIADLLED